MNVNELVAGPEYDLMMTKGYARILAMAGSSALQLRLLQPDDIEVVAWAMAKLGHVDEAAGVLMEYGMGEYDFRAATAEAQAMADDERGVWGYNAQGDRYHVCGKAFVEEGETFDCTDDYGHEGACNQ